MRNPWRRRVHWHIRRSAAAGARPAVEPGTRRVIGWIDAVAVGLTRPPAGPPEAGAARICDGLFTSATIAAVLIEKVDARPEYKIANYQCLSAAIEFMKVLGEDTLRRYRIQSAMPMRWDEVTPELDELVVARRMAQLGEALQIQLCAVTTDVMLTAEVREVAEEFGLPAATTVVEAFRAVFEDR